MIEQRFTGRLRFKNIFDRQGCYDSRVLQQEVLQSDGVVTWLDVESVDSDSLCEHWGCQNVGKLDMRLPRPYRRWCSQHFPA